ncbi:MAG: hypothetical protein ACYCUE_08050 [Steroidobacteraceae bacterium]
MSGLKRAPPGHRPSSAGRRMGLRAGDSAGVSARTAHAAGSFGNSSGGIGADCDGSDTSVRRAGSLQCG